MISNQARILVLAGTGAARDLIIQLREILPAGGLIAALAGITKAPPDLGVETQLGGFGGAEGLAAYLSARRITLVIDATHPFALTISENARKAAQAAACPLISLRRPPWQAGPQDIWQQADNPPAALAQLPAGARAFVTLGRRAVPLFAARADIWCLFRCVETPATAINPARGKLIIGYPQADALAEQRVMRTQMITHLVTRNSGGSASYGKIAAARSLGLPVIMISRPRANDLEGENDVLDTPPLQLTASEIIRYIDDLI